MKKITSKDGTEIAYDTVGKGPALVLVDGAFCFRASGTTPMLLPHLSKHFTVYAYDRRGRGDSGNTEPYAIEREIEDLQAVVKATGEPAYVLGMSSGAALALQAVASGVPAKKLALFEAPYVAAKDGDKPPADAIDQIKQMVAAGRRSDAVRYFMIKVFGMSSLMVTLMRFIPGVWAKNMSVAHTLPYDLALMGDWSVPAKAAGSITVPTLILGGSKSPAKLQNAVQALAEAMSDAQAYRLEGQSHLLKPKLITPALVNFFKD